MGPFLHLPIAAAGFRLGTPLWLLALGTVPAVLWLRSRSRVRALLVPYSSSWHRPSLMGAARWPVILVGTGLVCVVAALARPQQTEDRHESRTRGYDIVLCIDLSGSMLSEDYEKNGRPVNRLDAIRPVIEAFVEQRPNDRIAIVLFSARAYTLAPLTTDHAWIARQLERVKIGLIEDGTAIGDGLGVALTRLEQSARQNSGRREGAFIVLLTDGANNRGTLAPMQAAAIARARGIPIYTIGAGKDGLVRYPIIRNGRTVDYTLQQSDLDEGALRDIAAATGGHFFRAAETGTITSAFAAIDQAQKIEFQAKSYLSTTELFPWLLLPGVALVALGSAASRRPTAASA